MFLRHEAHRRGESSGLDAQDLPAHILHVLFFPKSLTEMRMDVLVGHVVATRSAQKRERGRL